MTETVGTGLQALRSKVDARVNSYFSSCVNCGICAESCLFYTETRDPRYTPIYKAEPLRKIWQQEYTFWGKLGKKLGISKLLTEAELASWEPLVYDACSMCGRCSMVCPVGVDVAYLIQKVKESLASAGHSPQSMLLATQRAVESGSPMGNMLPALRAQIKHIEADTGLTIPVDVESADYMALLSSLEVIHFPEYIESLARIFHQAGVSWTLCSEAFEATNSGLQIADNEVATQLLQRVVTGAEKLKVKYVISPECGHAYSAIRWAGPNFIGKPYSFEVIHILELLDDLQKNGRLLTSGMDSERLTFHDPCQLVRRGGVDAQPRRLLNSIAQDFVEMADHGNMNWCCGGGGGVSSNERAEGLRLKAFGRKKAQLLELNVEKIVTACSNCRIVMEDGLEANEMDIPIVGLTELIAEHLVERQRS